MLMLHPDLAIPLVAARIEDRRREAARRHAIRLARRSARDSCRPDATCVPAPDRGPVTDPTCDCVNALGLAPDHDDLGAQLASSITAAPCIPAGRAGDHDKRHRRDSPILRS